MMAKTSIEWCEAVWNVTRGCSRVSSGCGDSTGGGCYAERQAHRFSGPGMPYEGLTKLTKHGPRWTGVCRFVPEMLTIPLHRRKPTTWFVNSMSDLFHEAFGDDQIAAVFGVMAYCDQHRFIVLTKRAKRMHDWFASNADHATECAETAAAMTGDSFASLSFGAAGPWPLPNVVLGVSCENQKTADERIPWLLQTPAAIRVVSLEPLLGPINLRDVPSESGKSEVHCDALKIDNWEHRDWTGLRQRHLDWVIAGCESGPKARPCDEEWVRSIRDQCSSANVSFFLKQLKRGNKVVSMPELDGKVWNQTPFK